MKESQGSLHKHKTQLKETLAAHLSLNNARLKCLSTLVLVLIQEKSVNLVSLSLAFQGHAKPESSYRRIKRFFSEVSLDKQSVARFILSTLPPPPYTLCVDRTNWRFGSLDINILVIAVAHRGVAFPLVWTLLEKKGNSSSNERIDLLHDLFKLIKPQDIDFFLADREFVGGTWFNYLDKRRVPFAIRIRKDSLCENWCPVYALFAQLPEGQLHVLSHAHKVYGCTLRLVGMKLAHQDYLIIATNRAPTSAFLAYRRRWEIEMLFSALKLTGFNIEATHLAKLNKLDTLFTLLALALVWAHHIGEWLHDSTLKPLRLKSHLRREKSFFRHGLDHLRFLLKNLPLKHRDLSFCIQLLSRT